MQIIFCFHLMWQISHGYRENRECIEYYFVNRPAALVVRTLLTTIAKTSIQRYWQAGGKGKRTQV